MNEDKVYFTIGRVAEMLDVHPRTLRNYEDSGLIRPMRKGAWRYYTMRDIQWLECLMKMIHDQGVSINGVKKLLKFTTCWNIVDCPFEKRKRCSAFFSSTMVPRKIVRLVPVPDKNDIAA